MNIKTGLFIYVFFVIASRASAQTNTADELFQQARSVAFDQKDYPKAKLLCKQALIKSPDYMDIRIFLGRLYTWSKQPDSARAVFQQILTQQPDNEDASFAYGSLEYWNDHYSEAIRIADAGLTYHQQSKDLLLLKAKLLKVARHFNEANAVVGKLLNIDPKNTEARALADRIKDDAAKNKIGVSYDFVYFDKEFNAPWHLASIDYTRQTSLGSVTARFNYANRFGTNGSQVEIDAYPHLSQTFYAYLNGGYSNTVGVFPNYRAGFSLYANLPYSFEAEGGFRYLYFSGPTWIYTASVSKYYKNYWFNFRTFLTPSNNDVSRSFALTTRYYFAGADDYLTLVLGTGVSPDDPQNNILLNSGNNYKLKSNNLSAGWRHSFKTFNVIYFTASLDHQEYLPRTFGNQLDLGIGYQRRF